MPFVETGVILMKVACLQMNMIFGCPQENYAHAEQLIADAMQDSPDVLVLPETWNTGFFPREQLPALSCRDGEPVKLRMSALAKKYRVNLVAGSVSNQKDGSVYNTAMVFDRTGACIASYDKTHLFTPMGEHQSYTPGSRLCLFSLDGVKCGIIICYDLRFPELSRSLALQGAEMLFVVSQWPRERIAHLRSLCAARAIENQLFVVCCNSCGTAGETVYGGHSAVIDPLGVTLAEAKEAEEILSAVCSPAIVSDVRQRIPVFSDRRPELY